MIDPHLITSNSSRLDRDALLHIPRDRATECAYLVLGPMHQMQAHEALAAIAVAFAAVSSRYSQDPSELHAVGLKVLREPDPMNRTGNARIAALQDFAKLKLRDNPQI